MQAVPESAMFAQKQPTLLEKPLQNSVQLQMRYCSIHTAKTYSEPLGENLFLLEPFVSLQQQYGVSVNDIHSALC